MNKILRYAALLAVTAVIGISTIKVRAALESEKESGTRSVSVQDSQIENATLIIGSHLIHINGLTDELYAAAQESANEFNQYQMYYKSELADGAWFEISEASSIADITTSGNPVNKSVIEALEFTHMTGSNGITTDLRTGQWVSVFDIKDPYDLNALEELEPLRIQYQILQEKTDKNESDGIYLDMIQKFFAKSIKTDKTKECDAALNGLGSYKDALSSREKPAMWSEKTEGIMTSVDAERRVASLTVLADYLDTLENDASGMGESLRKESTEEDEEVVIPDFIINSEIVSAVGDCIKNVEESISAYEAKRMTDSGDTASAKLEYQYSQEMIVKAKATDTPGCDKIMESLCDLQNILDGVIANQDSELEALTSELVKAAFQKYAGDLRAGISSDYQTAQSEGASQAVLVRYLETQKSSANADRLEYQTMLSAQFQRMQNTQAQSYLLQLISGVDQLRASILEDAAKPYLKETVEEHLAWLRKEYAEQVKNASDDSEIKELEKQIEDLTKKYQDMLNQNNLAEAKKLLAEIEALKKQVEDLTKKLTDILNSPNSTEADKANARAQMGDNSAAALISAMSDQLSSDIRSEGKELGTDLQTQLEALAAAAKLDPEAGKAALSQVQEALEGATGLSEEDAAALQEGLSEAVSEVEKAGAGDGGMLSGNALSELLDEILTQLFDGEFSKAASDKQAAALLAMEWYGNNKGNNDALLLAASLAKSARENKNPYLYYKYGQQKEAYMSLQALGKVLSYRYIFDDWHNTVTLEKTKEYYIFTAGSLQYEMTDKNNKNLKAVPELMETLYIHGNDSSQIFDAKAEYITKSDYAVVGTAWVETSAKEIYDRLLEGGA